MKRINTLKGILSIAALVLVLSLGTIVVCAYYMSRVYLYNDEVGGKQLFRVGMELNTFFDKINSGTTEPTSATPAVAENTPLGIACTDVDVIKLTNGTNDFDVTTVGGVTYYTNRTSKLRVKVNGDATPVTYEYVYNPDSKCSWGSASNPYLISRINHLQNLYVLQNLGFFSTYYEENGTATMTEKNMPYFLICTSLGTPVTIDGTDMTFTHIGNEENPFIGYLGGAFITSDASGNALSATVNGQSSSQSVVYNLTVETKSDVPDVGLFGKVGYLGTVPENAQSGDTFDGAVSTVRDFLLYDVKVKVKDKTLWEAIISKTAHLFTFSSVADEDLSTVPHETHHIGILAGHVEYATVEYISVYYSNDTTAAIDVDMSTKSSNNVSANFYSVSGILGYVVGMNSAQAGGVVTVGGSDNDDIAVSSGGDGSGGGITSGTGRGYVTAAEIYAGYSASGKIVKVTTGEGDAQTVYYGLLVNLNPTDTIYMDSDEDGTTCTTNMTLPDGTPVKYSVDNRTSVSTMSEERDFFGRTSAAEEVWTNYVVHDLSVAEGAANEYYYFTGSSSDSVVYAKASEVSDSSVSMKYAAQANTENNKTTFTRLCTQYERERIGTNLTGLMQTTDRYYFYDGVFTFALSEASDSIDLTWEDGTPDSLVIGQNDDSKWTQDESALPNSVVAFMKPVTTEEELRSGKELFIAYKEGNSYHIVTLAKNSTYTPGGGANAVTTDMTTLSLVSDTLYNSISASLNANTLTLDETSYTDLATLKTDWSSIQILDLGAVGSSGLTLEQLRNTYQVKVTARQQDPTSGTTEDDGITAVTTTLQTNAKASIGSIYYAVSGTTTDSSRKGATEIVVESSYGDNFRLFTLEGSATVNLTNAQTAINTNNTTYYDSDGVLITGQASSPLSTRINIGSAISQDEIKFFDGYWYWEMKIEKLKSYYYFTFVKRQVSSDGTVTWNNAYEIGWTRDYDGSSFFNNKSSTVTCGNSTFTVYTVNGYTGRMYAKNRILGTYKEGYTGGTPNGQTGSSMRTQSEIESECTPTYTATYHYIVQTTNGAGTTYTFDGITNACSSFGGATGKKTTSINGYGLYSTDYSVNKDYNLYTCVFSGKTYNQCVLISRTVIDGIILQTMTGNGATVTLVNGSGSKLSDITLPLTDTGKTLTVDSVVYKLYRSANGKLGIRAANFAISGYFTANITPGSATTYKLNDSTLLHTAPAQISELTYPINNGKTTKNYNIYMADGMLGILLLHTETDQQYFYQFWHATSAYQQNPENDPDPYTLQALRRVYRLGPSYAGLIVGTNAYVSKPSNFSSTVSCTSVNYSEDCNVILNHDGTAYLEYTVNGTKHYLAYSSSGGYFHSSESQETSSKLYLFTVEGTHDSHIGNKIVPVAGTQVGSTLSADQYVLWPNNIYDSTATVTDGAGNTTNTTSAYNPANTYSQDTSYAVRSLEELYQLGWKNKLGSSLTPADLSRVFALGDGISDVNMINLWGGNSGTLLNADNYVKAPIGTTGEEAYIPTGCIAFRVNKTLATNKIRVIVAVPVSQFYYGQKLNATTYLNPSEDALNYSKDYSFCMWKVDEANSSSTYSFSVSNCYASFELPRSTPYDTATAGTNAYEAISGNAYSVSGTNNVLKYITVTMNGQTYRAYLNGEQVLVAYEFDATEEGVYLLGSTAECRIVHFSADSSASGGKDGVISYRVGTVDFVYDNGSYTVTSSGAVSGTRGTKILTVRDTNKGSVAVNDYSLYYYASLNLLYTDNMAKVNGLQTGDTDIVGSFPNINNFLLYIRRVATYNSETGGYSTIAWQAKNYVDSLPSTQTYDAAYLQVARYAVGSDAVVQRENGKVQRTSSGG